MPDYLLSPLTYAVMLAVGLPLAWRRLPRWGRYVGVLFAILLPLAMTPVGANTLVWLVESRLQTIAACQAPTPKTIVLLSGGTDRIPKSPSDYAALDISSLRRLFAAVALWRRTPNARLVIAGGGYHVPESVLLASLAESLGVPSTSIETEQHSHTTWENAMDVATLVPVVSKRIWLVSSAIHLPRALGAFRARGFDPCVWPSDSNYVSLHWRIGYFVPQSSALVKADSAIHELIGGAVYVGLEWKLRHSNHKARLRDSAVGVSHAQHVGGQQSR